MSLDNHHVIDFLSMSDSGHILLTIADDLDWSDEPAHIEALQQKLNTYLAAIESGQVYDMASDAAGIEVVHSTPVVIEIVAAFSWPLAAEEFLAYVKRTIAAFGVELAMRVFPPSQQAPAAMASARDFCARAIAYLRPALDDREVGSEVQLGDDYAPVLRDLANGLLVAYLVDQGGHFEYVQRRHLRAAELDEDAMHGLALANLARHAHEHARVVSVGDIFAVISGGNFEASYLLVDELWDEEWRAHVAGRFAAVVPARDVLAFGDGDSAAAVGQLHAVVARAERGDIDHRLIDALLTRVDGRWR